MAGKENFLELKSSVKRGRVFPSLALTALTAVGLSVHIQRQFDLHHTGLLATKLVAVGQSFEMHSEIFSQYGPLLTWLQAPFLLLGFSPVVTLHLWAVIATSTTVFLIGDLGRIAPGTWKISQGASLTAAAIWVVLDPTWRTGFLNAWSSLLVALMFSTSLYFLALGARFREIPSRLRVSNYVVLFSGVLVGLSPFARINSGVAGVLVLAVSSAIFAAFVPRLGGWFFRRLITGLAIGLILPTLVMAVAGSLSHYWSQGVVGPLIWAQSAIEPTYWNTWSGLLDRLLAVSNRALPLLLLMIAGFVAARRFRNRGRTALYWAAIIVSIVLLLALEAYLSGSIDLLLRASREPGFAFLTSYDEISLGVYQNNLYFLIFAFLLLAIFQILGIANSTIRSPDRLTIQAFFLLVQWGLSLALVIQVVPTYDNRHAWWALPLAILSVVSFIENCVPDRWSFGFFGLSIFLLFLIPMLWASSEELSRTLQPAPPNSFAAGTSTTRQIASEMGYQLAVAEIVSSTPSSSRTYYMVRDGSVAAIDGVYRSDFPEYVWWASRPTIQEIDEIPWGTLVIDSWTASFLGFEDMTELVQWFDEDSNCVGEIEETVYCVIQR